MENELRDLAIVHNQAGSCFEAHLGGRRSWLDYEIAEDRMVITHVVVHPELRGRQIAVHLMQAGLQYARAGSLRVVPQCAYANAYMRRHTEDRDLLRPRS